MIPRPYFSCLILLLLVSSCGRQNFVKLPPVNRESTHYNAIANATQQITEIAFQVSDTVSLKILIDRISRANCFDHKWRPILNKLHYDVNIRHTKSLDLEEMRKYCKYMWDLKKHEDETEDIIKANREVLSLMNEKIIDFDYSTKKFKYRTSTATSGTIYYTNITNGDMIADIGSGENTLGIFIGALYPETNIYCTELDSARLNFAKARLSTYNSILNQDNFHFILGDTIKTNLETKVDLIILSKTLHHFDHPSKMLQSIKMNLKENGTLMIFEPIPKRNKKHKQCRRLIKKKKIYKLLKENDFQIAKRFVAKDYMFLFYKNDQQISSMNMH